MTGFIWYRQDCDELESPETAAFANALGLPAPTAVGHLIFLKAWLTKRRPLGDVGNLEPVEVARGARFHGEPRDFMNALTRSGWVDAEGFLRWWPQRQGAVFAKAIRDRVPKSRRDQQPLPGTDPPPARGPRGVRADSARKGVGVLPDQDPDQNKEHSPRGVRADSARVESLGSVLDVIEKFPTAYEESEPKAAE